MVLSLDVKNLTDLKKFLNHFDILEKSVNNFLKNKRIVKKNNNIYLVPNDYKFLNREVGNKFLIFLKLKKKVPSLYLLKFIKNNSKCINIKNQKKALSYTYGKDLVLTNSYNGYALITNENLILGIGKIEKFKLKNIFNVGEYLREN